MLASDLKTCTIWAPSISLPSASSKSDGQYTSKQDSKSDFWPLLRTPCSDRDGGQSAFSTSNMRSLFPSLTCIVMHSCTNVSKCTSSLVLSTCLLLLRFLCRLPGKVDFVRLDWRVKCDCCRLHAMRLMHSYIPK